MRRDARRRAAAGVEARHAAMLGVLMQFRVIVRTMRDHYRRVERVCGVGGAHVWALAQIAEAPGIRVTELARKLAIHQSTASNMVERLAKSGLVSRVRSPDDRRVVFLQATARGRRVVARAPQPVEGALQHALAQMSPAKLTALHGELAALLERMHASAAGRESLALADAFGREPRARRSRST
jgi:DNA-binding MarR family transcriptional regulator